MFTRILVPVDITEADVATPAIDMAVTLAAISNASVRLVAVQLPLTMVAPMEFVPQSYFDDVDAFARKELAALAAAIKLPIERVTFEHRMGTVYVEVLAEAESWGADLIIVGAHRPSMATYLLGSSAAAIVRHATCNVLVVRSAKQASVF